MHGEGTFMYFDGCSGKDCNVKHEMYFTDNVTTRLKLTRGWTSKWAHNTLHGSSESHEPKWLKAIWKNGDIEKII